jgi:hypothetical protein
MLHLLSRSTVPDVGSAPSEGGTERHASTPVLITEQEVVFSTAAATLLPPATVHRRWRGTTLTAAIGHIHIRLPEPRPIYPRHEATYFEGARMSRLMEHL